MSGVTLNDVVVEWGSHNGANAYNPAKDRLTAGMSQDEVAAFAGATNWNDGLRYLAQGPPVLQEAVLLLDASFSDAGEPRVINRGTGGSALNAKYGSVLGAYVYDGAAVLNGIINNGLTVPDAAALDIVGDIEIVARVALTDWTPAVDACLIGKWGNASQRSYYLRVNSAGTLAMFWTPDGTFASQTFRNSTVVLPAVDGTAYWVKGTLDVNNGAAGHTVRFYYAADQPTEPTSWTQLGADVVTAGVTSIFAGTDALCLGATTAGSALNAVGSLYRGIVRNGIDGTTVLDVDLADVANYATSFTATTGQTVTVNSTSSDTNDPLLLTHTGENYFHLPIGSSNSVRQPAQVGAWPGDIEVQWDWDMAWSALDAQTRHPFESTTFGLGNFSTDLYLTTLTIGATPNANTYRWPLAAIPPGRAKFRFRRTASTGVCTLEYRLTDGASWTTIAPTTATPVVGVVDDPTTTTGTRSSTGGSVPVKSYYTRVYSGFDGTLVYDFSAEDGEAGDSTFTSSRTGQTVTVNRATSGRKTALVTRPIWLFGTDDYLEVADNALLDFGASDDFTVMAVLRKHHANGPSVNAALVSKTALGALPASKGWQLYTDSSAILEGKIVIADGTVLPFVATATSAAAGQLSTVLGVRNSTNVLVDMNDGAITASTTDTTTGGLENALPMRVGSEASTAVNFVDAEIAAVAVWRRVLTADEIAAINQFYGTA